MRKKGARLKKRKTRFKYPENMFLPVKLAGILHPKNRNNALEKSQKQRVPEKLKSVIKNIVRFFSGRTRFCLQRVFYSFIYELKLLWLLGNSEIFSLISSKSSNIFNFVIIFSIRKQVPDEENLIFCFRGAHNFYNLNLSSQQVKNYILC